MTQCRIVNASGQLQDHVAQYLRRLWQQDAPRRIGMAISGGVDSMALATLCKGSQSGYKFTGFIVDHGVRKDSSDEAAKVADELHRIGIEPRILRLDWSSHGNPKILTNFEAVARRLRYQAIGRACYSEGIRSLFVGHHADDQAETVLTRIVSGYLGAGLAGIQTEAGIPECAGIYGVDGSGWGTNRSVTEMQKGDVSEGMLVEYGGVNICRPLLPFTKDQLIQICRSEGAKWFDDPTNADRMLTIRNTIRYLHERAVLPAALQRSRLCSLASVTQTKTAAIQTEVDRLFDSMDVKLDLRLGMVTFKVDHDMIEKLNRDSAATVHRIKAALLRKLLQLVTDRNILLQDLKDAVDVVFSKDFNFQVMQVGKVDIRPAKDNKHDESGQKTIMLCRQKPNGSDVRGTSQLVIPSQQDRRESNGSTDWLLWDHRYWLRLRSNGHKHDPASLDVFVTFLTPTMLGIIRKSLDKQQRSTLDNHLRLAKSHGVVWNLPVIIARENDTEHVLSLPSLRWHNPAFQKWYAEKSGSNTDLPFDLDIRYISVNFPRSDKHQITS